MGAVLEILMVIHEGVKNDRYPHRTQLYQAQTGYIYLFQTPKIYSLKYPCCKKQDIRSHTKELCIIKEWEWGTTRKSFIPSSFALFRETFPSLSPGMILDNKGFRALFPVIIPISDSIGFKIEGRLSRSAPN